MFSRYKYLLIVNLVFPTSVFVEWESFSDCAFSRSLPTCTFLSAVSIFMRKGMDPLDLAKGSQRNTVILQLSTG